MGTTQGHCEVCGEGLGLPDAFRHRDTRDCIKRFKADVERLRAENERRAMVMLSLRDAVNRYHRSSDEADLEEINRLAGMCNQGELLEVPYVKSVVEANRDDDRKTIEQLRDSVKAADDWREEWETSCKAAEDENDRLRRALFPGEGVWIYQGDGEDHPESLTCQVLMTADQLRELTGLARKLPEA